jgi:hypothetical protein
MGLQATKLIENKPNSTRGQRNRNKNSKKLKIYYTIYNKRFFKESRENRKKEDKRRKIRR